MFCKRFCTITIMCLPGKPAEPANTHHATHVIHETTDYGLQDCPSFHHIIFGISPVYICTGSMTLLGIT